jgi:broad specificity phosphatase PhoE
MKLVIVRHTESEANINKNILSTVPDHEVNLTNSGKNQAMLIANDIYKYCYEITKNYLFSHIYCSPFNRTVETLTHINNSFNEFYLCPTKLNIYYDSRLREQSWGNFITEEQIEIEIKNRNSYSPFFYKIKDGESAADVYDRLGSFVEMLYRNIKDKSYDHNILIVTHGVTMRCLLMHLLNFTVQEYNSLKNPNNGEIVILSYSERYTKWDLETPLRKRSE